MEYSSNVFKDYISWLVSVHLQGDEEPEDEQYWDSDAPVPANCLREHQPLTYISWMFSDNNKLDLLDGGQATLIFYIIVVLLIVLSVRGFWRKQKGKQE